MNNTVDKVINIALSQVGYLEKSKAAYQADKNVLYKFTEGAGSDNYTKYGYEMHQIYPEVMDFPAYWCDCFVDWCFYQAYGLANAKALLGGNFDDYTVSSASLYKKKNAYYKSNPQVGDQIFFNNGSRICHTGLVYKVDGINVYTIEGNTSGGSTVIANGGSVAKKQYPLNYARIDGYGRPKYETTYPQWVQAGSDWYYRLREGVNAHGWQDIDGYRFYFSTKGKMVTGWQSISDKWYFFETDGLHAGALYVSEPDGSQHHMKV